VNDSGTLVLTRAETGLRDQHRSYKVLIDGAEAGKIKRAETLRFPLSEGRHTLQLKIDWCTSRTWPFVVRNGQTAAFGCAPSDAVGSIDQVRDGASRYITLRPLADPADLAAIETVPHAEAVGYLRVVGVGFAAGCLALVGGGIWHVIDAGSVAADMLLMIGVGVWMLSIIVFAVVKKVFEL
jgi:hypothetical protein